MASLASLRTDLDGNKQAKVKRFARKTRDKQVFIYCIEGRQFLFFVIEKIKQHAQALLF